MSENIEDIYELAPMQQGILFDYLYAPGSGAYNIQLSCLLRGEVNVEAFERAWQQVVNRHTSLRTSFHWEELDKPLQLVSERVKLPLEYLDWRGPSPAEQREMREGFLREDYRRGFDITSAPLMRLTLMRLEDDLHHFVWSYHHLITDGWSGPLIFREVFTLYCAYSQQREVSLGPSRPYGDYISWLQEQDPAAAESFWREALKGFNAPNVLQIERADGAEPEGDARDAQCQLKLSNEATAALRRATQQHQLTLNTIVQGAWALLVARYSGKSDVVFGAVVSNRPAEVPGVESMVGVFINTLPVRARVAWDEPVVPWLKLLQRQTARARQYEHTPLVQAHGWSDVPRGVPLFETALIFENYPMDAAAEGGPAAGLEITEVRTVDRNSFPLSLMVEPGAQLSLQLIYDERRYQHETVSRLLEHLRLLLEGIIADPARRLSQLPLLSETERRQLLAQWNATALEYARGSTLHELIEAQVGRTPEATAVVFESRRLTYRELNERANQVAHHLLGLGVTPESRVGVLMERSAEMLVALLGILKAGAAYVPLDPEYPQERLAFMLEDSRAEVLLTQQPLLERHDWAARLETRAVPLDTDWPTISQHGTENPNARATPEDLAYVIYTSGSTGKPKGVQIPHRAVVNFMAAMQQLFGLDGRDVLLSVTSLSFDIAGLELYLPLTVGAGVVLVGREVTVDPVALRELLVKSGASIMQATPSTWRMLLEASWGGDPRLKILCGGEALPRELAAQLVNRCGELWNMYGPTETTIWSLCRRIEPGHDRITIGFPIANTQVYVLDEHLLLVPVGVAGELYIGGDGLARGYLRRAGLTAERFVPDPFASEPGSRLYRTGDLVRFLPDGSMEFLGRMDHQVKVRGHRIELGEIEAALESHDAIQQCIALAREDVPGDVRLVAYVVPSGQQATTDSGHEDSATAAPLDEALRRELWSHLRERLPDYMVPSAFVLMPRMPLTPNGKVDRKALPSPSSAGAKRQASAPAPPRSHLEDALAALWAEVLDIDSVSPSDSFFELGGHSLLAMQVVSRVRERLGAEVGVGRLFAAPVLSDFALEVEHALRDGEGFSAPPLARVERDGRPLPLSFAQQRLWFLEQLEPGTPLYNIPAAVRLRGTLDVPALKRALDEIVRRHEVLRTSFVMERGEPAQVVAESAEVPLEVEEVEGTDEREREAWVLAAAREEAERGFDLGSAPLVRARLLRLTAEEHVALLTMHHIISDGWSMGVFVRELAALYEAYADGRESPLSELPIQYADYAVWQRRWLEGEVLERQLDYWRKQLEGAPAAIELPTDFARPAAQTYKGASESGEVGEEVSAGLRGLSRREGVTLYVTMLAAFKALLWRYGGGAGGGAGDVVIGTPTAGRGRVETEGLIGFFVNTLVLRTRVGDNPSFRELLGRVRDVVIEGHAHQDVPFEKLVEALQPERDMSRTPLFQVMFGWQAEPLHLSEMQGLRINAVESHTGTAKFDLTVVVDEGPRGLSYAIEYNSDLFEPATVRRMLGHYRLLLESVVRDAEQSVADLALLTEGERRQMLVEWNDTGTVYPDVECVQQTFEAQVERTPDAVAVMFEDEQLTYRELNALANQVGHRLRRLGVGPEARVGIYVERSLAMVAGVLGVLKAGGAYVPLDPSHPQERLSYVVRDAQLKVMLTHEYLLPVLPAHDTQVLCLDGELSGIDSESVENVQSGVKAENLAYVIYTSGSTGRPKGVMVTHRAVSNHMLWMQSEFPLRADDRVLQKTTFSFDASVWELFLPLMCGARLVMAVPGAQRDGAYLVEAVVRQRVTVLQMVPSMLQVLLGEPGVEKCESLRLVFSGGESLSLELEESFHARLGWAELHNLYGPTEAAIDVSRMSCGRAQDGDSPDSEAGAGRRVNGGVPIGRPVANTRLYVLDESMQPVPVGVQGELHVGGVQLARGYLRRPGLTAERFLPDPFGGRGGERLYRTGDVARYLPDGNLVFVGRRDQQVKVRGYRIELGEIEAALDTHPRVRQSVVLAREDVPGDKRLVAYLLTDSPMSADAASTAGQDSLVVAAEVDDLFRYELRGHLRGRLPDYMIPSAFVMLRGLPLTPSGKVDRKALPSPSSAGAKRQASAPVPPRSHLEDALAALWCEVLRIDAVSPSDSFFELGGHSLLAMQIVSRVRDRLGAEVSVGRLFAAPTLAGFAAEVERALRDGAGLSAPPLVRVERAEEPLPLSFAQQRLWFLEQLEPGTPLYNIPAAVRLKGRLDVAALKRALDEIVRRHEVLRTSFVMECGEPTQVISESAGLLLEVEEMEGGSEAEREAWVLAAAREEGQRGFDLGRGPLVRVRLLRLSGEEHVALLTMHHIISDAWSMGVFVRELAALYEAYSQGQESPLGELPIQYADYAVWQRRWLQGEVLERQLDYWRGQLAGAPAVIELPTDRARPVAETYRGASESGEVGEEVSAGLRGLSRREGVTLYVTMLAAFKALLWRYGAGKGGAGDVVVGSPTAGRGRVETEGLIGFFVNTLVLRTKVGDNPSFRELLEQVRNVVLGAHNHQDLPFLKLVEALNPERKPGYSPLVQVCFFLDTGPMSILELPGLTLSQVETGTGVAQFDLILGVGDTGPRLSTNMQYNADVFEPATVRHMLGLYEIILSHAVARPDIRLDELSRILAEADEQQRAMREKRLEELSFGNLRRIKRKVIGESQIETRA